VTLGCHKLCCHMAHRTVQCATGHCPVRQPRHPTVRVRPLELLTTQPSDSPVVHRAVTVHCLVRLLMPAMTSAHVGTHCSVSLFLCIRLLALYSRYSVGTPDSPVLHRTVRWIIAEWLPEFPKLASWSESTLVHRTISGGAPDTIRWHTGQSGAPDQGSLWLSFALFIWTLSWTFYWFVLNLWHL
jgi:hypothetical protein